MSLYGSIDHLYLAHLRILQHTVTGREKSVACLHVSLLVYGTEVFLKCLVLSFSKILRLLSAALLSDVGMEACVSSFILILPSVELYGAIFINDTQLDETLQLES